MTEGKNRQWILNARPAGKLTGTSFAGTRHLTSAGGG